MYPDDLIGVINYPDGGASPPAEAALLRIILRQLRSLDAPDAPELARLLPTGLATLNGPLRFTASDEDEACSIPSELGGP